MDIQSNGQIYIYVYGDAFFPNKPSKGNIYVNGNMYIDGVTDKNSYSPVPTGSKHEGCTIPGPPTNNLNEINKWEYVDGIKANYL